MIALYSKVKNINVFAQTKTINTKIDCLELQKNVYLFMFKSYINNI